MHNAKVKVEMKQLVDRHTVKFIFDYCCVQARNSLYKVISIVNTAYVHVRTDGIELVIESYSSRLWPMLVSVHRIDSSIDVITSSLLMNSLAAPLKGKKISYSSSVNFLMFVMLNFLFTQS